MRPTAESAAGAEFGNQIVGNMITCEYMSARTGGIDGSGHCSLLDGYPEQIDSDFNEQSGIYMLTSFNDVVGNRVSGQDNALFINQQEFRIGMSFHPDYPGWNLGRAAHCYK